MKHKKSQHGKTHIIHVYVHFEASFEHMKRHSDDENVRADFVRKRSEFKRLSSQSYTEYLKGVIGDFTSNSKRFWSFLKCFS